MKKLITIFFAAAMLATIPFIGSALSSSDASSVGAQTVTVRRNRRRSVASRTYRGGRYVVRRTWDGTKWVSRRVWVASKWTGKKTWKGGRKVVSRTKKVFN